MAVETVTVQMNRSDGGTSWGFRLQGGKEHGHALAIGKVTEGGLADRAGLREGDRVSQISGRSAESLTHGEAQQSIINSGNHLNLIVHRNVSTIYSPSFPVGEGIPTTVEIQNAGGQSSFSRDYSKKATNYSSTTTTSGGGGGGAPPPSIRSPAPAAAPYRPPPPSKPYVSPAPFGGGPATADASPGGYSSASFTKKSSSTLYQSTGGAEPPPRRLSPTRDYSPARMERPRSPAVAYLEKTGGLFGTDPNIHRVEEAPSYMKSETLKLIQEEQRKGTVSPAPHSPQQRMAEPPSAQDASGLPVCENCGQKIIGVFCKAGAKSLHAECFKCTTCGTSLKNIGYFLVHEKLYCELHAKQQNAPQFKAMPPIDPNVFATYGTPPLRSPRSAEPIKAFYQPDVLKPGGDVKSFSPSRHRPQDSGDSYSKSTFDSRTIKTFGSANGTVAAPRAYSPAPFGQQQSTQKGSHMTSAAGDGIQLFGPRTPNRGKGILKQLQDVPRIPVCESCHKEIRGPFVLAMAKSWCPDHFVCATPSCRRQLIDIGFIEQNGAIHCEYCYEKFYAPSCSKCQRSIIGDCLTAIQRQWHPECFTCAQCHKPFGNASFFLENGQPYCESDWNAMFTTKCNACQFPIEAGDRWVEALGHSYHSDCFCCTVCQKTLEGQSFYAKGGRPYCKQHA